ncbi:MAG: hypothetical protein ACPGJV_02890 [Bacteriovoracaceae bacterium]
MIKVIGSFFVLLASLSLNARELNYIESRLFRLSGHERPNEWVIPFYRYHKRSFPQFKFNIFASTHPEVPDVIDDIDSKDQDRIQTRLDNSFGQPYDASAKVLIGYRYQNFSQTFASNAGTIAVVNDPVFPELQGMLFQDYTMTSSYIFNYGKKLTLIPRIIYGRRRVLDSSFTAAQLADKKPDTKIKNRPWKTFVELSFNSKYRMNYLDLVFELNSLPISANDFDYWDTNLGVKSKNLNNYFGLDIKKLDAYLSYSPLYVGNYDVSRTIKGGVGLEFNDFFMIDIFFEDEFLLGTLAKLNTRFFTISLFTFERAYDDFHTQTSRQYGINLVGQY